MRRERVLIPDDLYMEYMALGDKVPSLDTLWTLCVQERLDAEFSGRTHGAIATYNAGCNGPICKHARRAYGRKEGSKAHPTAACLDKTVTFYDQKINWIIEQNQAVMDTLLHFGQVSPHYHQMTSILDPDEVNQAAPRPA